MPCVYSQCWCWQRYKHWQLSCVRREVIRSTKNIELFQSWALGVCHVIWLTDINLKGVESNFTAQWAKQKLKWVLASLPLSSLLAPCLPRSMILRSDKSETSGPFTGSNDPVSSCHCHVRLTQNDSVVVCYEAAPTAFWWCCWWHPNCCCLKIC